MMTGHACILVFVFVLVYVFVFVLVYVFVFVHTSHMKTILKMLEQAVSSSKACEGESALIS